MKKMPRVFAAMYCLTVLAIFAGCQSSATKVEKEAEHDHGHDHGHEHGHEHDHSVRPQSLREAIVELKELSDRFCSAMDEGNMEAAHEPLHDLGQLLETMPELAADTDLPEEQWKQVKEETGRLFNSFSEVDSTFHKKDGDKKAAYENTKSTIEAGVAALEAKLPLLGEDTPRVDRGDSQQEDGQAHGVG